MPITEGSITCRLYKAEVPQGDSFDALALALRRYAFRPIDDSRGERRSAGWVHPETLAADGDLAVELHTENGALILSLRTDAKRPNGNLLKARVAVKIEGAKREYKMTKLPRNMRVGIEEEVATAMLAETQPSTSFVQVAWDVAAERVIIACAGDSACDRVVDVFEATFGATLSPVMIPGVIAASLAGEEIGSSLATSRHPALGSRFLDWLRRTGKAEILSPVTFDGEGQAKTVTVKGETSPVESNEAVAALALNKRIVKACVRFDGGQTVTLDADRLDFRGYKPDVPKLDSVAAYAELRVEAVFALSRKITDLCGEFLAAEGDQ